VSPGTDRRFEPGRHDSGRSLMVASRTRRRASWGRLAVSAILLSVLRLQPATAQVVDGQWSAPVQLSRSRGNAGEAAMVADLFGYVHAVWIQDGMPNSHGFVAYARFDGNNWSRPFGLDSMKYADSHHRWTTAAVDRHGVLHVIWTSGQSGPTNYSRVGVGSSISRSKWSSPTRLGLAAYKVKLVVDRKGGLHLLYSQFYDKSPGVYYVHSTDGGDEWSRPIQLDPAIPAGYAPYFIHLAVDEADELHAIWHYYLPEKTRGRSIHYRHSADSGTTWAPPVTLAEPGESDDELKMANPVLGVTGREVHVIWAGGRPPSTCRYERISTDAGVTWQAAHRVFGDLHGQAISDGLATDGSGRIHFIGQLRWPQGLYEATYANGVWSTPSLFYLIAHDAKDPIRERIHAHRINAVVRAGNQLVTTFTTLGANDTVLYAMHRTMDDADQLPALPIPLPPPPDRGWPIWVLGGVCVVVAGGVVLWALAGPGART